MHAKHASLFDVYGTKTVNIAGDKAHFPIELSLSKDFYAVFQIMLHANKY